MFHETTRTEATREAYRNRFRRLMYQHFRETRSTDYGDFVDWLIDNKRNGRYSIDTWWQYKSAVMAVFSETKRQGLSDLIERLRDEPTDGVRKKGQSPKGKSRSVSQADLDTLNKVLDHHATPELSHRIRIFMRAGILTGLRPIEWGQARLENRSGDFVLTVVNAKNTNERSHGEIRRMEILTQDGVRLVREQLRLLHEYINDTTAPRRISEGRERDIESYVENIRQAMRKAYDRAEQVRTYHGARKKLKRLFPYSPRHQFKNNARKSGLPPIEIAYLMGHGMVETHQRLYGRRGAKGGGFGVRRYGQMPQVLLDSQARFEAERAKRPARKPRPKPGME